MYKKLPNTLKKFIDFKMAIMGGLFMGLVVFGINYSDTYQLTGSATAALKQGAFTFVLGGIFMRSCELLATRIKRQLLAVASAVIIPSLISVILTFTLHSMKGTPKPVESTIPTAVLILPATTSWALMKRKSYAARKLVKGKN